MIICGKKPKESTKTAAGNNNFIKVSGLKVNIRDKGTNCWKLKLKNNTIYSGIEMYEVLKERLNKIFSRQMYQKLQNIVKRK